MADYRANLEHCFHQCHERAWRLAVSLLGDAHEAFDAVQQAFLVAASKPAKVPADNAWPWFAQVVVHEARNLRRKKRPQSGMNLENAMLDPGNPAAMAVNAETRAALRAALDGLPEGEREALALTQLSGMTHAQAAAALGIPVKTVSTHVARGLERLRGRLGSRAEEMMAGIAAAALMIPPGGWQSALASWKSAALSGAVSTAAAAATTGAIMAKQTLIVASVVLVVGLVGGAALHHTLGGHIAPQLHGELKEMHDHIHGQGAGGQPAADDAETEQQLRADLDKAAKRATKAEAARDSMRVELDAAQAQRDEARRELDGAMVELKAFRDEAAMKGPVFTFGKYGAIEGVTQSDWKELSHAARVVADVLREIRALQKKGEPVPRELHIKQQRFTEMVRKYEYLTIDVLPSAARHNGELTHPISHANLIAGELKQAGMPLSEDQVKRIEALGLKYESDIEAAHRKYGENTLRCEKLQDEFLLKGTFVDAVWDVLSAEQRALFVSPETLHIAGTDLYCPTLMLIHTSPVVTGADAAAVRTRLRGMVIERFKLQTEGQAALDLLLDQWIGDVNEILAAVPRAQAGRYTYAQAVVALRAHVRLAKGVRDTCGLDTEARATLLDDYTVYIPRVVE